MPPGAVPPPEGRGTQTTGDGEQSSAVLRAGRLAWALIGLLVLGTAAVGVLAALSELVLPLVFAVVVGAVCHPAARRLEARVPAGAAAGAIVGAIAVAGAGLVFVVIRAVVGQFAALDEEIGQALDELDRLLDQWGLEAGALDALRDQAAPVAGAIGRGLITALVGGVDATIGFLGGVLLGMLLMYYVLKDGPELRDRAIGGLPESWRDEAAQFVSTAVGTVRSYWAGRAVLSAVVAIALSVVALALDLPLVATIGVVNFVGGFVPYIGAFLGGGLTTLLALSEHGIGVAVLVLVLVVAANVVLENLLEPRIMSERMAVHPLLVLVATTAGGVLGGIVGLVLAVPATVIGLDLVGRARRHDRARAAPRGATLPGAEAAPAPR